MLTAEEVLDRCNHVFPILATDFGASVRLADVRLEQSEILVCHLSSRPQQIVERGGGGLLVNVGADVIIHSNDGRIEDRTDLVCLLDCGHGPHQRSAGLHLPNFGGLLLREGAQHHAHVSFFLERAFNFIRKLLG